MPIDALKIAVLDDHTVFAEALAARLDLEPDIQVVAVASNRQQLLDAVQHRPVDVLILDYDLGSSTKVTGVSVGEELLQLRPDIHFVIVSGGCADEALVEAARLGMSGWVPKDASVDLLLDVLRGVRQGETYIPARLLTTVLRLLTQRPGPEPQSPLTGLTPRETDVLQCMVEGMNRAEIAEQLSLSQNTVRTHVQRVLHKLGVHSSLSAVARAREAGLVGMGSTG